MTLLESIYLSYDYLMNEYSYISLAKTCSTTRGCYSIHLRLFKQFKTEIESRLVIGIRQPFCTQITTSHSA